MAEDGHRLGRVSFAEAEKLLKPLAFAPEEDPSASSYGNIDNDKGRMEYPAKSDTIFIGQRPGLPEWGHGISER